MSGPHSEPSCGQDVRDRLAELRYLVRSIGRTGLLAMKPVMRQDARSLWQVFLLEDAQPQRRPGGR